MITLHSCKIPSHNIINRCAVFWHDEPWNSWIYHSNWNSWTVFLADTWRDTPTPTVNINESSFNMKQCWLYSMLHEDTFLYILPSLNFLVLHLALAGQLGDTLPTGCLHRGLRVSCQPCWNTSKRVGGGGDLTQCEGAAEHRDPLILLNSSSCPNMRPVRLQRNLVLTVIFLCAASSKWLRKRFTGLSGSAAFCFSTTET